jgi:ubiquinone/menaquinone biosynthesis C-methylase UbiE
VINGTNVVFIAKNSFPQNESFIKSIARLLFQLRFLIIWIFLKTIRWIRPNKNNDYLKDIEYIEWANKICKKTISDDLHDSYLSYVEGIKGEAEVFDNVISPGWWKEANILEIGSGLGQNSHQIAERGARKVVGVEYSIEKVNWSKSYFYESKNKNLKFVQGNAESLDFPDSEFDFVFSISVLEHIKNPEKALQEMFRVLKPGGKLLLGIDYFHAPGGNHLYDYIFFPWATNLVSESSLCRYWSDRLQKDQEKGKMGFYTSGTQIQSLGEGSEIQLNKWNSDQMEQTMTDIGWSVVKKVPSFYLGTLPIFGFIKRLKFYLQGGVSYKLIKN